MGKHTDQRDRTLLLARILQEETDDKHPLPLADLVTRLARYGVAAERKSIYRDMAALRKHGLDVTFRAGAGGGWYVGRRDFSSGELRAIIDAVSVYRWIPEEQRKALLDKLAALAPRQQREGLRRPVAVRHRSAAHPDEVRTVIDRIHAALQSRKAISFVPVVYDRDKCRVAAGPRRVVTPKGLIWSGEDYHLLAWDHRDRTLRIYRPDRMDEVVNTGMPAQGPETDAGLWTSVPFGLEPARRERIRLRCCKSLAGEVLDQLGEEAVLVPEGENFTVTADVVVGPRFWGWMAAHGNRAAVIAPSWAAKVWQERYGLGQAPLQAQFKAV